MPYKVQGKVLGTDNFPIDSSGIMVKELAIPTTMWTVTEQPGSAWVDQETGSFTLYATRPDAIIQVSGGEFIKPKLFQANKFNGIVIVEENVLEITGTVTKPKSDNSLGILLAVLGLAAIGAIAMSKKAPAKRVATKKQPKEVIV